MELKLFFSPGSCARVPLIALEEIGCPFEARLIVFMRGEHKSAEYLDLNPAGKVPLLLVDGEPLAQNVAILTFLADQFPAAGLIPLGGDSLSEARLLSDLAWCSSDLHPLVTRVRLPQFACDLPGAPERVREMAGIAMTAQLAPLEARLDHQPWLWGERWSVMDAYVYWVWFRITGAGFSPDAFPNLARHKERMEERPSVQRVLAREGEAEAMLEAQGLTVKFPPVAR
jgi:glutathione S-transferase